MLRVNTVLPWLSLCQVWLKTARTRALPCEKQRPHCPHQLQERLSGRLEETLEVGAGKGLLAARLPLVSFYDVLTPVGLFPVCG